MAEYYYNVKTKQVEEGPVSPVEDRMGPYASREDAARAFEIAAERNEKWEEEDKQRREEDSLWPEDN